MNLTKSNALIAILKVRKKSTIDLILYIFLFMKPESLEYPWEVGRRTILHSRDKASEPPRPKLSV